MENGTFVQRPWVSGPGKTNMDNVEIGGDSNVKLMTYNILSDVYIGEEEYTYCPSDIRYMWGRHHRIVQEILHADPDVVCLQEVALVHYEGNLKRDLGSRGYEGIYMSYMYRGCSDGLAIFYKRHKMNLLLEKPCPTQTYVDHYFQVRQQLLGPNDYAIVSSANIVFLYNQTFEKNEAWLDNI